MWSMLNRYLIERAIDVCGNEKQNVSTKIRGLENSNMHDNQPFLETF
jgi:hypothetical protein